MKKKIALNSRATFFDTIESNTIFIKTLLKKSMFLKKINCHYPSYC